MFHSIARHYSPKNLTQSMNPINKSSWLSHVLGLERVFALRGPLTYHNSSILDRALLEWFRPVMIVGSFSTRKPSIMSKPEWSSTTLLNDSTVRPDLFRTLDATPDLSFLMDLLAQYPVLIRDREKCLQLAMTKQPYASQIEMWSKVLQLCQSLAAWKERWDSDHDGEVYEVLSIANTDSTEITPWSTIFSFSNIEIASTFIMHQALIILFMEFTLSLIKDGLQPSFTILSPCDNVSTDENQLTAEILIAAVSICRSIEYLLPRMQSSGAFRDFHLFLPMHFARRSFSQRGCWTEKAWLTTAFNKALLQTTIGLWADMDIC